MAWQSSCRLLPAQKPTLQHAWQVLLAAAPVLLKGFDQVQARTLLAEAAGALLFQKLLDLGMLGAGGLALMPAASCSSLRSSHPPGSFLCPATACPLQASLPTDKMTQSHQDQICAWQQLAAACRCLPVAGGLQNLQGRCTC